LCKRDAQSERRKNEEEREGMKMVTMTTGFGWIL